jgi:hypothetical protein
MPMGRSGWAIVGALLVVGSALVGFGAVAGASPSPAVGADWGQQNNTTQPNYSVTFHEVGLPAKTNWSVVVCITWWCHDDWGASFNTSNTSSIGFSLPNGTYNYRVFPVNGNESNPDRGTFTVNGTSPAPITVSFVPPAQYTVTFTETGLPAGTNWSVFLYSTAPSGYCGYWGWWWGCGGHGDDQPAAAAHGAWHHHGGRGSGFETSNTSTITFQLTNGTYNYTAIPVSGYSIVGASNGSVNVSGAAPTPIAVTYSVLPTYTVTFVESGLPAGTNWTVDLLAFGGFGGWHHHHHGNLQFFTATSSGTTISFNLTNGTYHYRVGWVPGYYSNDSRGRFTVAGASPSTITINFTAIPEWNMSFSESGLPAGSDWGLIVSGVGGHHAGSPAMHVNVEHAGQRTVSFELPNGHYHFKLIPLHGWTGKPTEGKNRLVVAGSAKTTTIKFTPAGHGAKHGSSPAGPKGVVVGGLGAQLRSVTGLFVRAADLLAARL